MLITQAPLMIIGLGHHDIEHISILEKVCSVELKSIDEVVVISRKEFNPVVYCIAESSFENLTCISTFVRIPKKIQPVVYAGCHTCYDQHLKWKPPKLKAPNLGLCFFVQIR